MATSQISKKEKDLYVKLLNQFGEQGLYEKAVGKAMCQAAINVDYDVYVLNLSDSFLALSRRTGNKDYAVISRVLRRTAHAVYRQLIKRNLKKINTRFLNLIS